MKQGVISGLKINSNITGSMQSYLDNVYSFLLSLNKLPNIEVMNFRYNLQDILLLKPALLNPYISNHYYKDLINYNPDQGTFGDKFKSNFAIKINDILFLGTLEYTGLRTNEHNLDLRIGNLETPNLYSKTQSYSDLTDSNKIVKDLSKIKG